VRRLDFQPAAPPRDLGEVPFKSLYVKEICEDVKDLVEFAARSNSLGSAPSRVTVEARE
jgi:hypothetical protein